MTIPVYPFVLGNRVAFTHADVLGPSAQEFEPSGVGNSDSEFPVASIILLMPAQKRPDV
jgi:hypothetical protein